MLRLILATRNNHKVFEIRAILGPVCEYSTLRDFQEAPEVVEDARTFAGNAVKKSLSLARWICDNRPPANESARLERFYTLADDSGLEVDALNGAPGVHSARFAAIDSGVGGNSSDA